MIESRLDALNDDTGGGYGRYPGLTVAQTAERFRYLVDEGQGRSARAILRIAREQIDARGTLSSHRWVLAFFVLMTLVLLVARFVVPSEMRPQITVFLEGGTALSLLFAVSVASLHRTTRRGEAQVREIRRLALLALDRLVARDDFPAVGLEREHAAAFQELRKVDPKVWARVDAAFRKG